MLPLPASIGDALHGRNVGFAVRDQPGRFGAESRDRVAISPMSRKQPRAVC